MSSKELLRNLFRDGLEACSPAQAMKNTVSLQENMLSVSDLRFDISDRPVYILAVGKASLPMFKSANSLLDGRIAAALVIATDTQGASPDRNAEMIAGSHPVPDEHSVKAGHSAVGFVKNIPENGVLLTLISGGTSSLLCKPAEGISIDELSTLFELLNNSGATIHEINTVRKHCSQIKGGQLLRSITQTITLVDLVISDVPDDDLSIIGSGPTVVDDSTYQDAYHILLEYELWDQLPASVRTHIEKGITGEAPETLKPGDDPVEQHHSFIISSARKLAEQIAGQATEKGMEARVADCAFNEDVEQVAARIADEVCSYADNVRPDSPSCVFIYYGESTVNVTGSGKGGRNQELALRGALKIAGRDNVSWLSAGTDGIDGPTDVAGAMVDGNTIFEAKNRNLDSRKYLANNDSYHFHQQMGTLLKTGPTGNNLMDIVLVLVE